MLRKLLRQNISKAQLFGFAIANFAGLTIVLLSIQLYLDVRPIFDGKDSILKKDYFVVTKNVSIINSLIGHSGFSAEDIARLESQSFVGRVGSFTSSQFEVYGDISAAGMSFGADLFFEAIPTEFIDIRSDKWHFDPQKRFIPIIVPQNYLDLYNFGFATSRKMPSISSGTVQMVRFDLNIAGNGTVEKFEGGIVGFSNRINTILVPEEFMTWANSRFAPDKRVLPARLIVEISNITDPSNSYLLPRQRLQDRGRKPIGGAYGILPAGSFRRMSAHRRRYLRSIVCHTCAEHISYLAEKQRKNR